MILKTNLHLHTKEDDMGVHHDIYKAIDYAKEKNFDVLAYTPHKKFFFKREYCNASISFCSCIRLITKSNVIHLCL